MDHHQVSPRMVSSPSSGGCIYQGRGCCSQLFSEELLYVGMKLGSICLFLVLGQTLGISKARYALHKVLSAASDAQGLLKQQAVTSGTVISTFLRHTPTPICLRGVPLQPCSVTGFLCPWAILLCHTPNFSVCLC